MNTSQHDLSSMQVLFRLLLFLEFNLFIILHIDRFVNTFTDGFINKFVNLLITFSWTSLFLTSFPNFSGTKWSSGLDHDFHEEDPPAVSEGSIHDEHFQRLGQHVEVHNDHRIVDPMLQNTTREDV